MTYIIGACAPIMKHNVMACSYYFYKIEGIHIQDELNVCKKPFCQPKNDVLVSFLKKCLNLLHIL